jgi:hypothetical protein
LFVSYFAWQAALEKETAAMAAPSPKKKSKSLFKKMKHFFS